MQFPDEQGCSLVALVWKKEWHKETKALLGQKGNEFKACSLNYLSQV
jgi:hypothetical protein